MRTRTSCKILNDKDGRWILESLKTIHTVRKAPSMVAHIMRAWHSAVTSSPQVEWTPAALLAAAVQVKGWFGCVNSIKRFEPAKLADNEKWLEPWGFVCRRLQCCPCRNLASRFPQAMNIHGIYEHGHWSFEAPRPLHWQGVARGRALHANGPQAEEPPFLLRLVS